MTIKQPARAVPVRVPGLPLVGNLLDLARNPLEFVTRLQQEYGDVALFSMGKGNQTILISDPQAVKQVLLETGKVYSRGTPSHAMKTVLGNVLWFAW